MMEGLQRGFELAAWLVGAGLGLVLGVFVLLFLIKILVTIVREF